MLPALTAFLLFMAAGAALPVTGRQVMAVKSAQPHMEVVTLGYDRAVLHISAPPRSGPGSSRPLLRLRVCRLSERAPVDCRYDTRIIEHRLSATAKVTGLRSGSRYSFELLYGGRTVLTEKERTLERPSGRRLAVVSILSDLQLTDESDHYLFDSVVVGEGRSWIDKSSAAPSREQRLVLPEREYAEGPHSHLVGIDSAGQMYKHSRKLAEAVFIDSRGAVGRRPVLDVLRGDLVQGGRRSEFAFVSSLARRHLDTFVATQGNHDMMVTPDAEGPRGWRRHLGSDPRSSGADLVADVPGLRIVVLNTSWPEVVEGVQHEGLLTGEQMRWLGEVTAGSALPVIVLGHHPLERTFGANGAPAAAAVRKVLSKGPVWAYLSGHTHNDFVRPASWRRGAFEGSSGSSVLYPCTYVMLEVFEGGVVHTSHQPESNRSADLCEGSRRTMLRGPHPEVAEGRGGPADRNLTITFHREADN